MKPLEWTEEGFEHYADCATLGAAVIFPTQYGYDWTFAGQTAQDRAETVADARQQVESVRQQIMSAR